METLKVSLGILASLLSIYNFYLNRKSEKKIKGLTQILEENNITLTVNNKGNRQATSGDNGVSIVGKKNTVSRGKDG
ncbi:hypothetical protein SAMN05428981_104224 [Bacillus sp. OV194]|nr:hypothetical protein SAMN05428981_104224 [Bacillus sp. OV194]